MDGEKIVEEVRASLHELNEKYPESRFPDDVRYNRFRAEYGFRNWQLEPAFQELRETIPIVKRFLEFL